MRVNITARLLRKYLAKHPDKAIHTAFHWYADDRVVPLEIDHLTSAQLDTLADFADTDEDEPGVYSMLRRIKIFRRVRANPGGALVRKLDALVPALKLHLKDCANHWLFHEDENGHLLPGYISNIEFVPRRRKEPSYVVLELEHIQRGEKDSNTFRWYRESIKGKTVGELLLDEKLYFPTEDLLKAYEVSNTRYKEYQPQTGSQFLAEDDGRMIEGENSWSNRKTAMVREGVADKLVMDDLHEEGEKFGDDDPAVVDFWLEGKRDPYNTPDADDEIPEGEPTGMVNLPVHPFVKLFNLDRYAHVLLHVDQLTPYKWHEDLGDKLILPASHKQVIKILMDTASQEMDDIIAGKSGGTIVICTGVPGTGKTLTAEVTSEVIKRPLYKVQCSQLGIGVDEIEKELQAVLNRAQRWGALLLIDEADVYVRERGTDIIQNAIVGVFLRVLEYYRGVLFLTSNLATILDDAILSRATAHIKYERPSKQELTLIWMVLAKQFGVELKKAFVEELVAEFPTIVGRDVKNLLKLAVRYKRQVKVTIDLELFKQLAVHKDIKPIAQK